MNREEWWPCSELTLQGNLTIAGHAQKIWHARASICEIYYNMYSGTARIDTHETCVFVSPGVIQHATLDLNARDGKRPDTHTTTTPSGLELAVDKPLEEPSVAQPTTRADEILAELETPATPVGQRRRRTKNN